MNFILIKKIQKLIDNLLGPVSFFQDNIILGPKRENRCHIALLNVIGCAHVGRMDNKAQKLTVTAFIGPVGMNSFGVNAYAFALFDMELFTVNHELYAAVQNIEVFYILMPVLRNVLSDTGRNKVAVSETVEQRIVVIKYL